MPNGDIRIDQEQYVDRFAKTEGFTVTTSDAKPMTNDFVLGNLYAKASHVLLVF